MLLTRSTSALAPLTATLFFCLSCAKTRRFPCKSTSTSALSSIFFRAFSSLSSMSTMASRTLSRRLGLVRTRCNVQVHAPILPVLLLSPRSGRGPRCAQPPGAFGGCPPRGLCQSTRLVNHARASGSDYPWIRPTSASFRRTSRWLTCRVNSGLLPRRGLGLLDWYVLRVHQ